MNLDSPFDKKFVVAGWHLQWLRKVWDQILRVNLSHVGSAFQLEEVEIASLDLKLLLNKVVAGSCDVWGDFSVLELVKVR